MLRVLIRMDLIAILMSTHVIGIIFLGTPKRVLISLDKQAIGVRVIEVLLYMESSPAVVVTDTLTVSSFANCVILHVFCRLGNFLNRLFFFQNNLSGMPSGCQTVWIQIRPDFLSGLIWVQTVCKNYQQTTKVATSGKRVKAVLLVIVDGHEGGSSDLSGQSIWPLHFL